MVFTRQLATLIDAGLPLLRGLNVLAKQERAAADEQRQIAQAAEERALASLTKAKAAFLVIDAQATLSGTRSGTRLLSARASVS